MKSIKLLVIFFSASLIFSCRASTPYDLFIRANAAYVRGDFAQALADYQTMSNPGPAVLHNMSKTFHRLGDQVQAFVYSMRAVKASSCYSTLMWQFFVLIVWYIIVSALVLYYGKIVVCSKRLLVIVLIVLVGTESVLSICLYKNYVAHATVHAVLHEQSVVRAGPDNHHHQLGVLEPLSVVTIVKEVPLWCHVAIGGKVRGWVCKQSLTVV